MKKQNKLGFTLLELGIIIIILAIISSISLISINRYSKEAKNSVKISDLKNLEEILILHKTKKGSFPKPNLSKEYTDENNIVWNKGTFGRKNALELQILSGFPLDYNEDGKKIKEYSYSISKNGKFYKLETILNNGNKFILSNKVKKKIKSTNPYCFDFRKIDWGYEIVKYKRQIIKGNEFILNEKCPKDVVIPDTYKGEKVISIGPSALSNLYIFHEDHNAVCNIENKPFCTLESPHIERNKEFSLTSIKLPNSIIKIGETAFAGNDIKEFVMPYKITIDNLGGCILGLNPNLTKDKVQLNYKLISSIKKNVNEIPNIENFINEKKFLGIDVFCGK